MPPTAKPVAQHLTKDSIVVLASSLDDEDEGAIVASNAAFIEMLFEEHLKPEEIARDAMRSYHVDQFIAEFENGGFSQFVYNTLWDPTVVAYVREGLAAMGSKKLLKAFEKSAKLVEALGKEALDEYVRGGYFGENDERDDLSGADEWLINAFDAEDILELHAAWLRKHPKLFAMKSEDDMLEEARRRGAALPDRAARIAAAEKTDDDTLH